MRDTERAAPASAGSGPDVDLLPGAIDTENTLTHEFTQAVFLHGYRVGHIRPRGDQFEGITSSLESIGRYNCAFDAARALIAAARR